MVNARLSLSTINTCCLFRNIDQSCQGNLHIRQKIRGLCQQFSLYDGICLRACSLDCTKRACQLSGVLDHSRNDLLARHIDHGSCLDVNHLAICLILNLGTRLKLCPGKYAEGLVEFYCLLGSEGRDCVYHGADVRKAASFCLFYPCIRVTVAVENDALVVAKQFLDHVMYCSIEIICLFQLICCLFESLCHDGVQDYVGRSNRIGRTYHTELELVSGESER